MSKRKAKPVLYKDANGYSRWKLRAVNGKKLCNPGQDFHSKSETIKNILRVRKALMAMTEEEIKALRYEE